METGPWRTPSGVASVVPFTSARELLDAMIEHVARAAEVAIAMRVHAGEISDRGDAASTYFLDPARVQLLAQPPSLDAELGRMSVECVRRDRSLLAGLVGSNAPLARACEAWRLDDDERRIVLALVAASVSPRVARLLALLGGDPAAPAITVDAIAALLAPGDAGAARIAARLAARQPLELFGLVQLARPDLPLVRRPLVLAARVVDLALGRGDFDASCGAAVVPALAGAVDTRVAAAVRAIVDRGARPVVGVVGVEHDSIGAVATAAAECGHVLLATALSVLLDGRAGGVLREAVLQRALLAADLDIPAGIAAGAAIERVAALLPIVLVCSGHAPPRMTAPVVRVPTVAPSSEQLAAAFGSEVPPAVPTHLLALTRGIGALAARNLPPDALVETIAEQLVPPSIASAIRGRPRVASRTTARRAGALVRQWLDRPRPRRLAILIAGRAGIGKLTLASTVAQQLGIQAHIIEAGVVIDPALAEAIAAGAAAAVLCDLGGEGIRRLRSNSWWARTPGLLLALTSERVDMIDTSPFDTVVRLEPPDADERAELWTDALERRGIALDPQAVRELSRFPLTERLIADLLRSQPAPTLDTLVAAIRRDMGVRTT